MIQLIITWIKINKFQAFFKKNKTVDPLNQLYFTDPRYAGYELLEQPVEGVYRLDQDGMVTLLTGHAGKANGIVIFPDHSIRFMYRVLMTPGWRIFRPERK